MRLLTPVLTLWLVCNIFLLRTFAQEENSLVYANGKKYITLRVHSLEKYNARVQCQQEHLLKRLTKKERRLANKLSHTDSAAYSRYLSQTITYDSISKIATNNTSGSLRKNRTIDSLKSIQSFLLSKAGNTSINSAELLQYSSKLSALRSDLNQRNYINELIAQRTNSLKNITGNKKIPAFTNIQKNVFYSKQKMKVFKEMEEEPTKAEETALEYLQGTPGFNETMDKSGISANSMLNMNGDITATELEKKGFQTKQQVQAGLLKAIGNNLSAVQQQMSNELNAWQAQLNGVKSATDNMKQTKGSLNNIKKTEKPAFKVNPMRGLPFSKRLEKQYNFNVTRATLGGDPATLQLSAMVGFRHTPKLTYGLGVATSMGLGQDWNHIHISMQGMGIRTYAEWKWQYGIGAYAGYERMYKQGAVFNTTQNTPELLPTPHNTNIYSESVLIGLTKTYHMNNKWNGAIQLLYDVWWQQKGLQSPIQLRFSTIAK